MEEWSEGSEPPKKKKKKNLQRCAADGIPPNPLSTQPPSPPPGAALLICYQETRERSGSHSVDAAVRSRRSERAVRLCLFPSGYRASKKKKISWRKPLGARVSHSSQATFHRAGVSLSTAKKKPPRRRGRNCSCCWGGGLLQILRVLLAALLHALIRQLMPTLQPPHRRQNAQAGGTTQGNKVTSGSRELLRGCHQLKENQL